MLDDGTIRQYNMKDFRTQLAVHMAGLQDEANIISKYMSLYIEKI